tara:strand:+ start:62636 stop:62797 length:162 start_codon:yes stop_codon:yes gene_type:complete
MDIVKAKLVPALLLQQKQRVGGRYRKGSGKQLLARAASGKAKAARFTTTSPRR